MFTLFFLLVLTFGVSYVANSMMEMGNKGTAARATRTRRELNVQFSYELYVWLVTIVSIICVFISNMNPLQRQWIPTKLPEPVKREYNARATPRCLSLSSLFSSSAARNPFVSPLPLLPALPSPTRHRPRRPVPPPRPR